MRHFVMCTYFGVSETETAFAPGYALAKAVFDSLKNCWITAQGDGTRRTAQLMAGY